MFEIRYLIKGTNKIMVEQLVAKSYNTAVKYAKQFLLHNSDKYELLSIR